MFILTCKNLVVNVYQYNQVDKFAKEMAKRENSPVTIDQFDIYLGDTEPRHHIIGIIA